MNKMMRSKKNRKEASEKEKKKGRKKEKQEKRQREKRSNVEKRSASICKLCRIQMQSPLNIVKSGINSI